MGWYWKLLLEGNAVFDIIARRFYVIALIADVGCARVGRCSIRLAHICLRRRVRSRANMYVPRRIKAHDRCGAAPATPPNSSESWTRFSTYLLRVFSVTFDFASRFFGRG